MFNFLPKTQFKCPMPKVKPPKEENKGTILVRHAHIDKLQVTYRDAKGFTFLSYCPLEKIKELQEALMMRKTYEMCKECGNDIDNGFDHYEDCKYWKIEREIEENEK